jgi:epoxyqueuosine reductase
MIAMSLEQQIKDKALALGFDAVGITDASPLGPEHVKHFRAWLRSGYTGRMDYMHRNLEKRVNPAKLLENAESVIVVALNYRPPSAAVGRTVPAITSDPTEAVGPAHSTHDEAVGKVAQYAQYEDYHPFIKSLLGELVNFIRARTDQMQRFKICVDSAPLAEKALAVRAGLGFIGKNHLLIHPQLGPQILLGEVVTTVSLCPDRPGAGSCTDCDRCLKACPTDALRADGFLDANRCISYLTQYGSQNEPAERTGAWLFGCDACLLACPFQQTGPACGNRYFKRYPERAELNPEEMLELTPEEFEAKFRDSPVRRLGIEMLKRNARRCLKSQV